MIPAGGPSSAHPSDAVVPITICHITEKLRTACSLCFFGSQDVSEITSMPLFLAQSDIGTVEEPTRTMLSGLLGKTMDNDIPVSCRFLFKECGNFRIVALADVHESEWETICCDIKGDDLRKQQGIISNTNYDNDACLKVESKSHHYKLAAWTRPTTINNKSVTDTDDTLLQLSEVHPLVLIAFLIWDHYRIALTSKFGLCVFETNKEMPKDILSTDSDFQSRLVDRLL
ncbi:hypothetical protein BGZ88_000597 [Linnemannia elongata]|nr:hypothetical protein BGZ88_000597 [Linnemannia elongata]